VWVAGGHCDKRSLTQRKRFDTLTLDATLCDVYVVLCHVLSQYRLALKGLPTIIGSCTYVFPSATIRTQGQPSPRGNLAQEA
jgi:hypothetical protein